MEPHLGVDLTDSAFTICEFSKLNLYEALGKSLNESSADLREDRARFFFRYLSDLDAATILIEHGYVDGDYLDDYAAYYVKCFRRYSRKCERLHFFSKQFTKDHFLSLIQNTKSNGAEDLRAAYIGFIVVRPLPDATIGRTILKPYPPDGERRNYSCTRNYFANLFGLEFVIRTLAYQEQDAVLAACATVSLWSCFNKTSELFGSKSPTPAEITRAATDVIYFSRSMPSSGLKVQQICSAIKYVGLEPEIIPVTAEVPLISLLYGYVRNGLPVILGVDIESKGPHAVAICGYSLLDTIVRDLPVGTNDECPTYVERVPMTGLRIDRLYAHDDQIGPFSRVWIKPPKDNNVPVSFEGSWRDRKTEQALSMKPLVVIIPVYHKIRVTFLDVHKWLLPLHTVFRTMLGKDATIEWDVFLTNTNEYKKDVREKPFVRSEFLTSLLFHQYPRFMWRIIFRSNNRVLAEFLVDATDIVSAIPFYQAVWLDQRLRSLLLELLDNPTIHDSWVTMLRHPLLKVLRTLAQSEVVRSLSPVLI